VGHDSQCTEKQIESKKHFQADIVGAIVVVITFMTYLLTLAPGLTWAHDGADGGDLATAVANLGIPHPPGYPTYILMGRLFAHLPLGDLAYRLNLMSAVMATLAVLGVYLSLIILLSRFSSAPFRWRAVAAASTALMIAFSPTFWSQALITEVYALNALFVSILIYLSLLSTIKRRSNLGISTLSAYLFGLSLGNHITMVLLLPVLMLSFWRIGGRLVCPSSRRDYLIVLISFALGLSIYAYLPLRAAAKPMPNWGDPVTLDRFIWMISGGPYRQFVFGLPISHLPMRIAAWAGQLFAQFGVLGVLLGLLGFWRLLERARMWVLATLISTVLYSIYAIGYNTTDSYVYLIPSYIIFALWIGHGISEVGRYLKDIVLRKSDNRRGPKPITVESLALAVVIILPFSFLWKNYHSIDLHNDREAATYGETVMTSVPAKAMIISASDAHTFALWYAQQIAYRRPDVIVLDRDLLQYDWYVNDLSVRHPDLSVPATDTTIGDMLRKFIAVEILRRPIYLTDPTVLTWGEYAIDSEGVLYRLSY